MRPTRPRMPYYDRGRRPPWRRDPKALWVLLRLTWAAFIFLAVAAAAGVV